MTKYISLDAAINEVGANSWAGNRLVQIPAADVRPVVRGKWECADDEDFSQPHVRCSNCGEYYFAWYRKFPYCPNCGADMREVNND